MTLNYPTRMDNGGPTLATLVEVAEGRIRQVMTLAEFCDLAGASWFRPGARARLEFESRFRPIDQIAERFLAIASTPLASTSRFPNE